MPLQRKNLGGEPDSADTTKIVFMGFGLAGLALVFALAYILGATSSDPVQHDLESNLVVVRQKVAQCGMERDRWRAKQKKKANKLSPLYTTQQENGNLQNENNQLMDDNESLRKERDVLEETINELHFNLDNKAFVNENTEKKIQHMQSNVSKPMQQWIQNSLEWGGIDKDALILKLTDELKVRKTTYQSCRKDILETQRQYTALMRERAEAQKNGRQKVPLRIPKTDEDEEDETVQNIIKSSIRKPGAFSASNERAAEAARNIMNHGSGKFDRLSSSLNVERPHSQQHQMDAFVRQQDNTGNNQMDMNNQMPRPQNGFQRARPNSFGQQQGFQQPQQNAFGQQQGFQQQPRMGGGASAGFGQVSRAQMQQPFNNPQLGQQRFGSANQQNQFGQQSSNQFGQQGGFPNQLGQNQLGQQQQPQQQGFGTQQQNFGQQQQFPQQTGIQGRPLPTSRFARRRQF